MFGEIDDVLLFFFVEVDVEWVVCIGDYVGECYVFLNEGVFESVDVEFCVEICFDCCDFGVVWCDCVVYVGVG